MSGRRCWPWFTAASICLACALLPDKKPWHQYADIVGAFSAGVYFSVGIINMAERIR